jgi:tetratricopeptide (TPR) repeat protein
VLFEKDFPHLYPLGLTRLGKLLLSQGKLTEPEELYQQALETIRGQDGGDSGSMAAAMYESTYLYQAQDRLEEAEKVERKVVETLKVHGARDYRLLYI